MLLHRVIAAAAFTMLVPGVAIAAPPPSGTISCAIASDCSEMQPCGLLLYPYMDEEARRITVKVKGNESLSCDATNVVGGKGPITIARLDLTAKLPDGNCVAFTSGPALERGRIKVQWRGPTSAGRVRTVATSKADIATATYDIGSHALILTTTALEGAFAGTTLTLHFGFDAYIDTVEAGCGNASGFLGLSFGDPNPSTLEVQ